MWNMVNCILNRNICHNAQSVFFVDDIKTNDNGRKNGIVSKNIHQYFANVGGSLARIFEDETESN